MYVCMQLVCAMRGPVADWMPLFFAHFMFFSAHSEYLQAGNRL
jgi:hypothetical protein